MEANRVSFKDWLKMMGYDLGLQDELLVYESAWGKTKKFDVLKLADEYMKDASYEIHRLLIRVGVLRCRCLL